MDSLIKLFNWLCCGCIKSGSESNVGTTYDSIGASTGNLALNTQSVRIGAFNIQRFGEKKFNDKFAVDYILKILLRYDLTLIQEVQDKEKKNIPGFVEELTRSSGHPYKFIVSDYLGRKTYKEQYLYLYRSDLFEIVDSFHYDDGSEEDGTDTFQREPFVVLVKSNKISVKKFAIIGAHLTPKFVEDELNELANVHETVIDKWGNIPVVMMGDFNAGGSHISKKKLSNVALKTDDKFHWLLENEDTTVGKNTYTYDRIIVTGENLLKCISKETVKAFKFDEEYTLENPQRISDHYPVEFVIGKPVVDEL